jgi:hypothetical protein
MDPPDCSAGSSNGVFQLKIIMTFRMLRASDFKVDFLKGHSDEKNGNRFELTNA